MKLLFDEDAGQGAAQAILNLSMPIESVTWVRRIWKRSVHPQPVVDEEWIPWAAKHGYIVISRNTQIITTDTQRQLVADTGTGIVFVPQHITALELFLLLFRRWGDLNHIFENEPKPFLIHLPLGKPYRRDDAIPLDYNSATRGARIQMTAGNLRVAMDSQLHALTRNLRRVEWKRDLGLEPSEPAAIQGPPRIGEQLGFRHAFQPHAVSVAAGSGE